jgi:hypothetical protein
MEQKKDNSKDKVIIGSNVGEIEIDLDPPRLILIRGYNKLRHKWEEWFLRVTAKNKIHVV